MERAKGGYEWGEGKRKGLQTKNLHFQVMMKIPTLPDKKGNASAAKTMGELLKPGKGWKGWAVTREVH